MRQAPDCILIGEIRDQDTMQAAISAQNRPPLPRHPARQQQLPCAQPIISFFPLENRPALYLDLSVSLRAIISQRLVKETRRQAHSDRQSPAQHRHIVQELIEKGEIQGIKDAMEQSLAPGSRPSRAGSALPRRRHHAWTRALWSMPTRRPTSLAHQQLQK